MDRGSYGPVVHNRRSQRGVAELIYHNRVNAAQKSPRFGLSNLYAAKLVARVERSVTPGTVPQADILVPDCASLHPGYRFPLRGEIRDYRVEYRESGLRHAQPAVGVDDDGAFLAQHGDPARVERAA